MWCTIWILGAILVSASLDATPDPPALDPHPRIVRVATPTAWPHELNNQLENVGSPSLSQLSRQTTFFEADIDPHGPIAILAEAGRATDTSPPA